MARCLHLPTTEQHLPDGVPTTADEELCPKPPPPSSRPDGQDPAGDEAYPTGAAPHRHCAAPSPRVSSSPRCSDWCAAVPPPSSIKQKMEGQICPFNHRQPRSFNDAPGKAAGGRGSLLLGSTTAPSGAVHEKSYVQATCAPPWIFSIIRSSSSGFLPHGSHTGSCATVVGPFSVGDR
ncbi:translation initiation factor IF-2-like isoform X2 [Triticum dicoccoides]|uniref:translation initiation factor IF-2-like isoform X2 n=1 Tax=Triticum dicoccoides TaxID=85692 RepID=UPI0018906612|nr:translation initiation factor IF-2-like isoform X2 [Triticum dicoccoides]